jgi:hypothetical protein
MTEISKWKKICGTIVGTLLLGALGSGLWDLALHPAAQWCGTAILTVATLGSSAIKDDNFREAARGLHEASSLQLFWLLVLGLSAFCSGFLGYASGKQNASKESPKLLERYEKLDDATRLPILKNDILALKKKLYAVKLALVAFGFLVSSILFINYLKLLQANNAYIFFTQSMSICRPYIDDQQARMLNSRFASVTGKPDYIAVTEELRRIAASNQRKLPDFKPW